jgi:hypothetical protein
MKVADLEGEYLDLWVAKAEGYEFSDDSLKIGLALLGEHPAIIFRSHDGCLGRSIDGGGDGPWVPSKNWAQGGPIIDREKIEFGRRADDMWGAWIGDLAFDEPSSPSGTGQTHLIAAMRAYVASTFGEEVPGSAK